jgi:hypothetical protein
MMVLYFMAVRLSDVSSKPGKKHKKCIFGLFLSLRWTVSQPSMPFASINPTDPRTNPRNFHKHFLRIGDFEKPSFQKKKFVLLHPRENWSKFLGYQGWVKILIITLVSSQKSLLKTFQPAV